MMDIVVPFTTYVGLGMTVLGLVMLCNPKTRAKNIFNDVNMKQLFFKGVPVLVVSVGAWVIANYTSHKDFTGNFFLFASCVLFGVALGQVALAILETFLANPPNTEEHTREYFIWELHLKLRHKAAHNACLITFLAFAFFIAYPFFNN